MKTLLEIGFRKYKKIYLPAFKTVLNEQTNIIFLETFLRDCFTFSTTIA